MSLANLGDGPVTEPVVLRATESLRYVACRAYQNVHS